MDYPCPFFIFTILFIDHLIMSSKKKQLLKIIAWSLLSLLLIIVFSNLLITQSTKKLIYDDASIIPNKHDVGLLLGTSEYTTKVQTNLFFKYRIESAAQLYHAGKIKHIIVSGDNSLLEYNEPRQMAKALRKLGIPDSVITLDFAGFRTLDSVVRCKKVFGQTNFVIITQQFHLERALFIAKKHDIDAIGFAAKTPPDSYSFKTQLREYLAKTLALIDLYILNTKPKFLGEPITIKI